MGRSPAIPSNATIPLISAFPEVFNTQSAKIGKGRFGWKYARVKKVLEGMDFALYRNTFLFPLRPLRPLRLIF